MAKKAAIDLKVLIILIALVVFFIFFILSFKDTIIKIFEL